MSMKIYVYDAREQDELSLIKHFAETVGTYATTPNVISTQGAKVIHHCNYLILMEQFVDGERVSLRMNPIMSQVDLEVEIMRLVTLFIENSEVYELAMCANLGSDLKAMMESLKGKTVMSKEVMHNGEIVAK